MSETDRMMSRSYLGDPNHPDYERDRAWEWADDHPFYYILAALGFWAILIYALVEACQ